jgi:hypothetical protein
MFEKHVLSALCVGASRLGRFFAFAFVAAWHSEAGREVRSFDAGSARYPFLERICDVLRLLRPGKSFADFC